MATRTRRPPSQVRLTTGPWKGVRDTRDPFDDQGFLVNAINAYIPDPDGESGVYARFGFKLLNGGTPIYSTGTFRGQCVHTHIGIDEVVYNFVAFGGHLFRVNTAFTTFTDVTPVGATIDGGVTTRVKMLSVGPSLVVSDGVNRPWIATNLGSTPITGTAIQYNAANDPWAAHDLTEYGGAVFYILHSVAGVPRHFDIAWTEPGLPDTGLQQTNFSNFWTVIQQADDPLTALRGTNTALFYFRAESIGRITGVVGPNLQSTATHDAAAYHTGTRSPQSIQIFGDTIYFFDAQGRPQSISVYSNQPNPIWLQLRGRIDAALQASFNDDTRAQVTISAIDPQRHLYIAGDLSDDVFTDRPPTQPHAFDARDGRYFGYWDMSFVGVEAFGTLINDQGRQVLVALGRGGLGQPTGCVWAMRSGDDSTPWADNTTPVLLNVRSGRNGYSADQVFTADRITVIGAQVDTLLVGWDSTGSTSGGAPPTITSSASDAGAASRYVCACDAQGRWVTLDITAIGPPLTVGGFFQFLTVQQATITGTARLAMTDDP